MADIDVAIVGGGPGGLAAACAILKTAPGLKVRVFERAPELRRVGFTLGMMDNGINSLEAISEELAANVMQHMLADGGVVGHDKSGEQQYAFPSVAAMGIASDEGKAGHLPWYKLQYELADWLPSECLVLGRSLTGLEINSEGATLKLTCNEKNTEETVTAKIVIGADGNQSVVREFVLEDGPPQFLNTVVWRGQADRPSDWSHDNNLLTGWNRGSQLMLVVKLAENRLAWQAFSPVSPEDLESLSTDRYVDTGEMKGDQGLLKRGRCLERYTDYPEIVQRIVGSTPPSTITEHGQFFREASECQVWGKGCATLMGDAAHLFTPFLGQGVNQTLEDSVEIGRSIGELGPTEEALRQYESIRIEPATYVQAGSVAIGKSVFSGNGNYEIKWMKEHSEYLLKRPQKLSRPRKTVSMVARAGVSLGFGRGMARGVCL
ncbi:hypothetical protein BSKO_06707 [Bryopsis sp. KO-2023]|nr:hypothetical protein BSKO_06707 [Bryopsis sp. KO-2023]